MNPIAIAAPAGALRSRFGRAAFALVCTLGVLLTLVALPAYATVNHQSEGSFGASETPSKSFGNIFALTVDNSGGPSAGDIYVGGTRPDFSGSYVYKFASSGKYTGVELKETPQGPFAFFSLSTYEGSSGLAVDGSTGANRGDVYVADANNHVIDRFNEGGEFLCEITGKEYLSPPDAEEQKEQEHDCAGPTGSKTPQNGFTRGGGLSELGVAVDPTNGDVYVADPGDKAVDEFNAKGEYEGQITGPQITSPASLAFNSAGELYVTNGRAFVGGENVVKFDASGKYTGLEVDKSSPEYVALNTSDGRVFVAEGQQQTAEYDSTGKPVSTFGAKQSGGVVAINDSSGRIYISMREGQPIYVYGKAAVVPNVKTGEAKEVKETTATLQGVAEPDLAHGGGNVESCEFDYASKRTLDHVQTVSTSGESAFGETFALRFERQKTGWKGFGRLSSGSTKITEVLSPEGLPTTGEEISGTGIKSDTTIVSYSRTERTIVLSQETEAIPPEEEEERQALRSDLTRNADASTVQYALEALPAIGQGNVAVSGPAGGPWRVEFAGSLAQGTVPLLRTQANGFFTMAVEPDWAAAAKASCEPSPPYSEPSAVSANVSGLTPSMAYMYRLATTDSEGAAQGETASFTTLGPPSVDRLAAEAKQTSVRLWAKINPFGADTTCQIQYVTAQAYQESQWKNAATVSCERERLGSASNDLGSRMGSTEFPYTGDAVAIAAAEGLARGTAYRYRFVVTNQAGSSTSEGIFETWGIKKFSVEELGSSHETLKLAQNPFMVWEPGERESPSRAGAHPYELVTTIDFSTTQAVHRCEEQDSCPGGHIGEEIEEGKETLQNVKDVKVQLPPGLVGNPTNLPKCNAHVAHEKECPTDSQVGILEYVTDYPMKQPDGFVAPGVEEKEAEGCESYCLVPLYNLEPQHANPAEFGNPGDVTHAQLPFEVRAGADYGITDDSIDIIAAAPVQQLRVRIWGVPGNPSHADGRQFGCPLKAAGKCSPKQAEVPLLRNPTSCTGPQAVTAQFDTWSEPGVYTSKTSKLEGFTGCDKLKFEPKFEAQPTKLTADSPTGLKVDLHVPQDLNNEGKEDPKGLATADLRNATVTLPAGMTVDPSSADGLVACTEAEIGYLPQQSAQAGKTQFTPEAAKCPDESKIGTVTVNSRLVDHPLAGAVYVAAQDANPFKSLLALYVAIDDAPTGLVVKLPGKVSLDPVTGQLTTTFAENPQLPFEDFRLNLAGGERASLTTPLTCGSYATSTDLTPWSAPEGKDAFPSGKAFGVTGPTDGACVSSEDQAPNAPAFEAGTASSVAGSYSPFVLHLKREDGSQRFSGLDVTLPPGLVGKIAGIEQCPQGAIDAAVARRHEDEGLAELAHPSCPAGSEVGIVHVGAGSGAPYYVTGHAYFAGPYKGAPFSLVIVTPAVAGPFDLGTVVVRAGLYVNPNTAQVSVMSDSFPTILDGIPLDIRSVNVDMNRREFTLNPTSCSVMSVTGQETSTAGQAAALSDRFQAGGCDTLPFHPSLSASASGIVSRKEGASFVTRVTSTSGQANIAKVKVTLPKQLSSVNATLKLACVERVFAANPASCPNASKVGTAVARTPLLASPLSGPVYLVSRGREFPDIEVVLQGEGITIILDGKTDIVKGITSSTFETLPDAPVSSFELKLPKSAHPLLAAPGGLCSTRTVFIKKKVTIKVRLHGHVVKRHVVRRIRKQVAASLTMPTVIQGQNGAVIRQQTHVAVTGCHAVAKHKKKHSKHGTRGQHGKKHG